MFESIKKLLGIGPKTDVKDLIQSGAAIIDVRSPEEYRTGHINGSKNFPLPNLLSKVSKLDKNLPIITCCASGMRSASAKRLLKNQGFVLVHNGGAWHSLKQKM
ncbi:rhodanese-like domain-containing protein [Marinilongibacter aquaticus]|uniref:rhodanese-like domain-containing protein n=1 Tax=Marinilongibacter aquaticus TaxID=2975157 RepID=UPI0021BD3568|nr:rhodanese-like domain-containing protein [Marinilongibacter aquaticus]UBM60586.1 rhodanese-like domain-containing protein [Marinilongibacter aquaticus]